MSFTRATTRTHSALIQALTGKHGQTLKTHEIRELVVQISPGIGTDIQWLRPSDHCRNHAPKGACTCAKTDSAPLERVERGVYRVVL
jgi:hypothetical protein